MSETPIPGTHLFDGDAAAKGFALNAMCYSFNDGANRQAFLADEDAYCAKFNLSAEQRKAVAERSVLGMIAAGGNIYYLAGCRLFANRGSGRSFQENAARTGAGRFL